MTALPWTLAAFALVAGLHPSPKPGVGRAQEPEPREQDLIFDHAHAAWTRVLARCVKGERFDYKLLSASRGVLDEYLLRLRGVQERDFATWTREQRLAFWINAYNAFTVQLVLTRYPIQSIQDIGTEAEPVWEKAFIPLGHLIGKLEAEKISLDTLEHEILRAQFEDARVHAALRRAAESGPPLRAEAYQAEKLERQLDLQARAWLADPRLNRFDRERGRVQLSALFDWREADFVRDADSLQAWLARFAPEDERAWLRDAETLEIDYLPFSWKLDDLEREQR